jgi:hypothetical protein
MELAMSDPNGNRSFDLAALAEKSTDTDIRPAATQSGEGNPFLGKVEESFEKDEKKRDSGWKEVMIPRSMLDDLITSMRALSTYFGKAQKPIGVHLRVEYQAKGTDEWTEVGPGQFADIDRNDPREVAFKYTGRRRMNRGRRTPQAAAGQANSVPTADSPDAETHAREDEASELQPA